MKVELLVTPNCSSCLRVEKYLDDFGIKYEVIDVTRNPGILQKYPIMAAPGIVINGKLEFIGTPNKEELRKKVLA
ncbi:thioredoxin family protein [Candidatus Woesearchaeota archaeon]|nr:thioredoxin family protein [Candidatus Woesearchaeota archaeon]